MSSWYGVGHDSVVTPLSANIKRLERAGGEIRTAKEDIDTSSSGGRLGRNTHLVVAEYEVDRSRESWMETHDHRRRRGVTHDGQLRFGYGKYRRPADSDWNPVCAGRVAVVQVFGRAPAVFDQSGVRVADTLYWLHVMCTHLVTFYRIHTRRGRAAMDDFAILPAFTGISDDALASSTG
jgi:hypothetical protein